MIRSSRRPGRLRRWAIGAAALGLAAVAGAPAQAGIDPGGLARVGVDTPYASDNVDVLGQIPVAAAVGARFQGNYMYVTGASGVTVYDVSNPALPVLTGELPLPHYENEDVSVAGNTLVIASGFLIESGTNILHVVDISNPRLPLHRNTFYLGNIGAHTAECSPGDCKYVYMASNPGIEIVETATGRHLGTFGHNVNGCNATRCYGIGTHDLTFDAAGIAWVTGGAGTFAYDMTLPLQPKLVARTRQSGVGSGTDPNWNDFIHHNATRLLGADGQVGDIVLVTEEDYFATIACGGQGRFETWRITGPLSTTSPAFLEPIDQWTTAEGRLPGLEDSEVAASTCSSHWFTERNGTVAVGWYEGGVRFLEVHETTGEINQVGYWDTPSIMTWGAYFAPTDPKGEIAYTMDEGRGIDVVRFNRSLTDDVQVLQTPEEARAALNPPEVTAAKFQPHPKFGWACRIPVA